MVTAVMDERLDPAGPRGPNRSAKNLPTVPVLPVPGSVVENLVQLFKLLADETRLQILNFLLQQTELNVGTLCGLLSQSQPAVSHHLALMRGAGLIDMRRDGKHNFYRIQASKLTQCRSLLQGLVFGADAAASAGQSWGDLVAGMAIKPTAAGIAQLNDAPSSSAPSSSAPSSSAPSSGAQSSSTHSGSSQPSSSPPASPPAAPPDAAP